MSKQSKRKEYIFMWSQVPIMPSYWATPQSLKERSEIFAKGEYFGYYDGKVITAYMPKEQLNRWRKTISKKNLKPSYFRKYQNHYQKEKASWWKWIRRIEKKDYSYTTLNQLKKDVKKFQENMRDAIAYFASTRTEFTYQTEQRLEKIIKKHYGDNWPNIFGVLVESVKLDDVQKEYLDWLKLIESKPSDRMLLKHVSGYPWLIFGQLSEKEVLNYLKDRLKKEKNKYLDKLKETKKRKTELKKEQETILKKFGADEKEARYLSSFLQIQSVERMNVKAYWAGCYYLARNMWYKTAEAINLNLEDLLKFVSPPETQELLSLKYPKDIKKIVSLRKKSFAINYEPGKDVEILTYKDADVLFRKKIKKDSGKKKIIRGQTASLGIYKGRVRKVIIGDLNMLKESIKLFKEGEVLVTSMTQPNMMVIARKAGAIVADEGGITSHAAIISRELKIPCIVGCLKAMKVLKDGNLVEVDAEKGIVKIIKKN